MNNMTRTFLLFLCLSLLKLTHAFAGIAPPLDDSASIMCVSENQSLQEPISVTPQSDIEPAACQNKTCVVDSSCAWKSSVSWACFCCSRCVAGRDNCVTVNVCEPTSGIRPAC
jgi:hypothetical protein